MAGFSIDPVPNPASGGGAPTIAGVLSDIVGGARAIFDRKLDLEDAADQREFELAALTKQLNFQAETGAVGTPPASAAGVPANGGVGFAGLSQNTTLIIAAVAIGALLLARG